MSIIERMNKEKAHRLSLKAGELYLENPHNPKLDKMYEKIEDLINPEIIALRKKIERLDARITDISLIAGEIYKQNSEDRRLDGLYAKIERLCELRNKCADELKEETAKLQTKNI